MRDGADVADIPRAYRKRRCIIPVDCFFELNAIKGQRAKQPFAIAMKDGRPLGSVASGRIEKTPYRASGFARSKRTSNGMHKVAVGDRLAAATDEIRSGAYETQASPCTARRRSSISRGCSSRPGAPPVIGYLSSKDEDSERGIMAAIRLGLNEMGRRREISA